MNDPASVRVSGFRVRVLAAMMLLVVVATAVALLFAQHNVAETVRRDFERQFRGELAAARVVREVRHAAQAERCRVLARKPRIHAALEDNARDLLYPSARDELRDLFAPEGETGAEAANPFQARFYRFLDATGAVIRPPGPTIAGELSGEDERRLAVPGTSGQVETGFLARHGANGPEIDEIIAMPIISTETRETIASLVLGFGPMAPHPDGGTEIKSGLWMDGKFFLPGLTDAQRTDAERLLGGAPPSVGPATGANVTLGGEPFLSFSERINPGSHYPAAFLVGLGTLTDSVARQRTLMWEFVGAGVLVILGAYVIGRLISIGLSRPVERLAVDSDEQRAQRERAEHALGQTSAELQRSARFSSDASHQLKTPVTVLRAGLEELLADEHLSPEIREELSGLVHQTFRLTNVIEDLLLLSRMDAGRLHLDLGPVNLTQLLDGLRDDLDALPDAGELTIETEVPADLTILGERRYTALILQNLLENARKYNTPGGRIRMAAHEDDGICVLTIGNTGRAIGADVRAHIFERFHRGTAGENIPGHGLGLNLARELARLHGGDLVLHSSDETWTEFEVRFRVDRQEALRPRT